MIRDKVNERTVVPEHHSHVVLSPGTDVDQDAGRAGGAEAEHQLLFGQVGLTRNTQQALDLPQRRGPRLWQEVIPHQGSCLKVAAYI